MFPLIGIAEIVTVAADAALLAAVLVRWKFIGPRTFLAWLGITVMVLILYVPSMQMAFLPGTGPNVAAYVGIAILVLFVVARLVALRQMSKSSAFRLEPERPLAWGWVVVIPMCTLMAALVIGGVAQWLVGGL